MNLYLPWCIPAHDHAVIVNVGDRKGIPARYYDGVGFVGPNQEVLKGEIFWRYAWHKDEDDN
jgi:hypothetical protein